MYIHVPQSLKELSHDVNTVEIGSEKNSLKKGLLFFGGIS